MKSLKIIALLASLLIVLEAGAQTHRGFYTTVCYEHHNPDSNINEIKNVVHRGTIFISPRKIWIDSAKASARQVWFVTNYGKLEPYDEGYYLRDMICYGISKFTGTVQITHILLLVKPDDKTIEDVTIKLPYNQMITYILK